MKLFHKIFLCFVVIFSIAFQAAGYFLINYAYRNAIEQEKKIAFQDFQYNQYIVLSILYTEPRFFVENSKSKNREILRRFTVPVYLFGIYPISKFYTEGYTFIGIELLEGKIERDEDNNISFLQISDIEEGKTFFTFDFVGEGEGEKTSFQIYEKGEKTYIFVCGYVRQGKNKICLVTQTDISDVIDTQKSMIVYFRKIYLLILCIGFPIVFFLTKALTLSLKKVSEAAGKIAQGSYSQRIRTQRKDEIGELASSFNQMAGQVEEKIGELSNAAKQKEDFTANFAHELKTPMTSVIGYADMLYRRELSREEVKSAAGYIMNEGMRLETLSLKLMDLFVLDKQDFFLEKMSVKELFEDLRQGIEPVCEKHGVAFHMDIEKCCIRADFDLFKTMILNLADNAVKAGCKDLWIGGRKQEDSYQIEIKDNGKGIPPEELERITEAFYMVDKSRSRKQHGAGLGLALVSKIVELHKAKMKIESDGKTGTTVHILICAAEGGSNEEDI